MKKTTHPIRIRLETYKMAEEKAISLSAESGKYIKPTDIIDAAIRKCGTVKIKDLPDQKTNK
jgi:hypothetical protein